MYSKSKPDVATVQKVINDCKRLFYGLVGSNVSRTSLSPLTLSKRYRSIVLPKLLYGAEVKIFDNYELDEYNKFHCSMSKVIQCLPEKTVNLGAMYSIGWLDLFTEVDIRRLLFIHRILALNYSSVYRILFIQRLFYILYSRDFKAHIGPVAQMVQTCSYYDVLHHVVNMIDNGNIQSKQQWKRLVRSAVQDKHHANTRFLMSMYPNLVLL